MFRAWCELTATLGRKNGGEGSYPRKLACILFMESSPRRIGGVGSLKTLRAFYNDLISLCFLVADRRGKGGLEGNCEQREADEDIPAGEGEAE